jgi:D-sedoheptulose 7-phosphate isomerase
VEEEIQDYSTFNQKTHKECMNNLDALYKRSGNITEFARGYTEYLSSVLRSTDFHIFEKLEREFQEARAAGNTIFVAGNGGSATTASSMANDLGFDILKKAKTDLPLKVLYLTDNSSVITAISNDVGYENVFINQLKIHFRQGDKLFVISASGNSVNLVKAVEWVKSKGGTTIALLGFEGGKLLQLCDLSIHFKTLGGEYGPVEDAHLMVNHIFAHWFQHKFKIE